MSGARACATAVGPAAGRAAAAADHQVLGRSVDAGGLHPDVELEDVGLERDLPRPREHVHVPPPQQRRHVAQHHVAEQRDERGERVRLVVLALRQGEVGEVPPAAERERRADDDRLGRGEGRGGAGERRGVRSWAEGGRRGAVGVAGRGRAAPWWRGVGGRASPPSPRGATPSEGTCTRRTSRRPARGGWRWRRWSVGGGAPHRTRAAGEGGDRMWGRGGGGGGGGVGGASHPDDVVEARAEEPLVEGVGELGVERVVEVEEEAERPGGGGGGGGARQRGVGGRVCGARRRLGAAVSAAHLKTMWKTPSTS